MFFGLNQEQIFANQDPRVDKIGPRVDKIGPKVDDIGPKADKIGPKVDKIGPKVDKIGPKVDQNRIIIILIRRVFGATSTKISRFSPVLLNKLIKKNSSKPVTKYFVAYIRRKKTSNNVYYNIIKIYANITKPCIA